MKAPVRAAAIVHMYTHFSATLAVYTCGFEDAGPLSLHQHLHVVLQSHTRSQPHSVGNLLGLSHDLRPAVSQADRTAQQLRPDLKAALSLVKVTYLKHMTLCTGDGPPP
jgi:hypothetical protein